MYLSVTLILQRAETIVDNLYLSTFGFLPLIWLNAKKVREILNEQ